MTQGHDDRNELGELFAAQRRHDERRVPGFARVVSGARRPRSLMRGWWPIPAMAVALVVVVGVVREATRRHSDVSFTFTAGDMRVPTDFLLEVSGGVRAGDMPRIGDVNWYPLPPAGQAAPVTDTGRRRL